MPDDDIIIEGPIGPDNFERGDKALHAVAFYMKGGRLDPIDADEVLEIGDHAAQMLGETLPEGSPAVYMMADLFHLLRRYQFDLEGSIDHALAHYASDVIEQAWTHDEDWDNKLQDPSNKERAVRVMAANGVPFRIFDKAMVLTGLIEPDDPDHPVNK